jgi:hypothetical protein
MGATFSAEITHLGNQPIDEHGFVWGKTSTLDDETSLLVKLGSLNAPAFSHDLRSALISGEDFYVRAFVTSGGRTIYGRAVSFLSLGSEGPVISSVSPLQVLYGDTVHIRGMNFNYQKAANKTVIGGVVAEPVSTTDTLIVTTVPLPVKVANMEVSVTLEGNTAKAPVNVTLLAPVLGAWNPLSTVPCDSIEIGLTNISPTQQLKFALQGSQVSYRYNAATGVLKFRMDKPISLNTANVRVDHGIFSISKQYTVEHPSPDIVSFEPAQVLPGDSVRFVWENLKDCVPLSASVNGAAVPFTRKGDLITIKLPDYCISGPFAVAFSTSYGGYERELTYGSDSFLQSSTPSTGVFGTLITVDGQDFIREEEYWLYLGGEWITDFEVLSDTQLRFPVPQSLITLGEPVDIRVEGCLATDTLKAAFSLPAPEILSISPGAVTDPAAVITISANYLSMLDDYTYVYIDNQPVPPHLLRMNVPAPGGIEMDGMAFVELYGNEISKTCSITLEVGGMHSAEKLLLVDIRNPWEQKLDFYEGESANMASFAIQGKGFVTLGHPFNSALWQYSPNEDSWTEKTSFPGAPQLHPITFTTATAAFVGFGMSNLIAQQELWKYDVATDSWSGMPASPFNARLYAIYFSINGKGYYGGGIDDMGQPLTDFWEFNPSTESWIQKADIPITSSFSYLPSFSLNDGRGYIIGDAGGSAKFAKYNPGTNSWSLLTSERDCPDCTWGVVNDQVLLSSYTSNRIWLVKPSVNQWKEIPFDGVTSGPAMFEINGLIYYGLGEHPGQVYSPLFWSFDINDVN